MEVAVPQANRKSPHDISSGEPKKKIKDSKNCGLKKCFSALVDRKQVNLELEVLRLMLRKELDINLDSLEADLANILPYLLVHYIKNWPGWQKSIEYYSGRIPFKTWYEKFHKFITFKLSEVITTHYKEAMSELKKENIAKARKKYMLKKIVDKNSQTDNLIPKTMAPITIEIMAKPVLLNTLVFSDTPDGDIVLKQHNALEWDKSITDTITLKQLITWPHVGVHMLSPVFAFTRRNLHEFRRHISLVGTPLPAVTVDLIEEMAIINPQITRMAYTIDYIKDMSADFLKALKNVYPSPAVIEAFKTVIDEFLSDIKEINVVRNGKPTIANNTSILFNIGRNVYFRNKKLSKGSPSRYDIGYTEIVIPKMEIALSLLAEQDKIDAYLNYLTNFNSEASNAVGQYSLPQITFSCSYCQKNFENGGQIATHLKEEHKMEQSLLCAHCKLPFTPFHLTGIRWNHNCSAAQK